MPCSKLASSKWPFTLCSALRVEPVLKETFLSILHAFCILSILAWAGFYRFLYGPTWQSNWGGSKSFPPYTLPSDTLLPAPHSCPWRHISLHLYISLGGMKSLAGCSSFSSQMHMAASHAGSRCSHHAPQQGPSSAPFLLPFLPCLWMGSLKPSSKLPFNYLDI